MRETSWVAFFLCNFEKRGERFGCFCHRWGEILYWELLMTDNEKRQIFELRAKGFGYSKIAATRKLPTNTVKSFLYHTKKVRELSRGGKGDVASCVQCGAILKNADSRKRKFCSAKCRMAWWNTHQEYVMRTAYYSFVCPQCGKTFTAYGNAKRVYCSRECFAVARRKKK